MAWRHNFLEPIPCVLVILPNAFQRGTSRHRIRFSVDCVVRFQRSAWCWLKTIDCSSSVSQRPRVRSCRRGAVLALILSLIDKTPAHAVTLFASKASSCVSRFASVRRRSVFTDSRRRGSVFLKLGRQDAGWFKWADGTPSFYFHDWSFSTRRKLIIFTNVHFLKKLQKLRLKQLWWV